MADTVTTAVRCTLCYTEFTFEEAESLERCPECLTEVPPHRISQDVTLTLNWQELRALTIPAMRWYKAASPEAVTEDIVRTLNAILGRLYTHRPLGAGALTLEDEMSEAAERGAAGASKQLPHSTEEPDDEGTLDPDEDDEWFEIDLQPRKNKPAGNN